MTSWNHVEFLNNTGVTQLENGLIDAANQSFTLALQESRKLLIPQVRQQQQPSQDNNVQSSTTTATATATATATETSVRAEAVPSVASTFQDQDATNVNFIRCSKKVQQRNTGTSYSLGSSQSGNDDDNENEDDEVSCQMIVVASTITPTTNDPHQHPADHQVHPSIYSKIIVFNLAVSNHILAQKKTNSDQRHKSLTTAIKLYELALALHESHQAFCQPSSFFVMLVVINNNMGCAYDQIHQHPKARTCFEQVLALQSSCNSIDFSTFGTVGITEEELRRLYSKILTMLFFMPNTTAPSA